MFERGVYVGEGILLWYVTDAALQRVPLKLSDHFSPRCLLSSVRGLRYGALLGR